MQTEEIHHNKIRTAALFWAVITRIILARGILRELHSDILGVILSVIENNQTEI